MKTGLLLLFPAILSAQLKGVVKDSISGEPLSYVNIVVDNSPKATSSDSQGNFEIDAQSGQTLIFTAVGYKPDRISASDVQNVALFPVVYELSSVVIEKPKGEIEKILGGYKQKNAGLYYATNEPYLYARYFPVSDSLQQTPFLKSIVILTKSGVKGAKFNVHFLEANDDGTPGAEMARTNIIGIAAKGTHDTYIDLIPYKLRIPEKGFFVALETLIIPENHFVEYRYKDKNKTLKEGYAYAPFFATVYTDYNTSWGYREDHKWGKFKKVSPERIKKYYDDFKKSTGQDAPPFDDRYVEFAMKIILTN